MPFSQYLRESGYSMSFYIKIPKFGNHSLMMNPAHSGTAYGAKHEDRVRIWMTPYLLYDESHQSNDNNINTSQVKTKALRANGKEVVLFKPFEVIEQNGCDKKSYPGCHMHDIPPGKYLVEIVVANLTNSPWSIHAGLFSAY